MWLVFHLCIDMKFKLGRCFFYQILFLEIRIGADNVSHVEIVFIACVCAKHLMLPTKIFDVLQWMMSMITSNSNDGLYVELLS